MSGERHPACIRRLHWAVAAGVAVQLALGWGSEAITGDAGMRLLRIHFQLGMVLLALMLLRLGCRIVRRMPAADAGEPRWRRRLAGGVHLALYLVLFLLPVSGYVIWIWMQAPLEVLGVLRVPALFVPPADDETWRAVAWYVHNACVWLLCALVVLHVAAALWHQWVRRDGLLRRML
jgi:cytochrome b561